jgi:hypothetical protein
VSDELEKEISRGERAKRILGEDVFQDAFKALEKQYVDEWRRGMTPEAREKAHSRLQALEDVALELKKALNAGDIAAHKLKAQNRGKPA